MPATERDLMSGLKLQRLGMLMEPEPGNAQEVEGVLNPAAGRGPDGELYLFPRLVARGNYSRIGIARVRFNKAGDPAGVERLGIALEPEADYERRPDGGGGCEDPRITFVEPLHSYMMTYTAFSPEGPRIALALSKDLLHWKRLGLATFGPYHGVESGDVDDKDASLFPVAIPNPSGHPELAILHRPLFPGTRPEETVRHPAARKVDLDRESIWISYCAMSLESRESNRLGRFMSHHRLATPVSPWERLKIGGGTPPILTRHGWLIVYHGVSEMEKPSDDQHQLRYSAGLMVLSKEHPQVIRYRSVEPVLTPTLPRECHGTVAHVVFPTGIDRRDDLGLPSRFDVYYGMADSRIYGRKAGNFVMRPYMLVEGWIAFLEGKDKTPSVAEAKENRIHLLDEGREEIKNYRVYDCFGYELTFERHPYILSSGVWYEVVANFLSRVNDYITREIKEPEEDLPDWDQVEHEDQYNARCGALVGFLHFDCRNVVFGGGRSRFEFCDFMNPETRTLYFAKIASKSSGMSHLVEQVRRTAEMLFDPDQAYRDTLSEVFRQQHPHASRQWLRTRPQNSDWKLCLVSLGREAEHLPFFAKCALWKLHRNLTARGHQVFFQSV